MSRHGSVHPSQTAHFTESFAAYVFGFLVTLVAMVYNIPELSSYGAVLAGHLAGTCSGAALTLMKEGEDAYYKWKAGKDLKEALIGDWIDFLVHVAGFTVPGALVWIFFL